VSELTIFPVPLTFTKTKTGFNLKVGLIFHKFPEKNSISRENPQNAPRRILYFFPYRSIFDGGVKDLFYVLRSPPRLFSPGPALVAMECDLFSQVTRHEKPSLTEVYTEGRLMVEFIEDYAPPRIRQWIWEIRGHQEFIPRSAFNMNTVCSKELPNGRNEIEKILQDPNFRDTLVKDITRNGLPEATIKYLRVS
jgi:hypothetical protein